MRQNENYRKSDVSESCKNGYYFLQNELREDNAKLVRVNGMYNLEKVQPEEAY